jgi:hypothetical protein
LHPVDEEVEGHLRDDVQPLLGVAAVEEPQPVPERRCPLDVQLRGALA